MVWSKYGIASLLFCFCWSVKFVFAYFVVLMTALLAGKKGTRVVGCSKCSIIHNAIPSIFPKLSFTPGKVLEFGELERSSVISKVGALEFH